MLVLENSVAVRPFAFSSAATSTMPNAFFWFGQMMNQTLNHMIVPNHTDPDRGVFRHPIGQANGNRIRKIAVKPGKN